MKILITTDWYKPVINGVVTSVENLCRGLTELGHEVRILTLSNSLHSWKEENVYYIGSVSVGKIYPNARLKMTLRHRFIKELIEWRPDVVHSQCEFSTFLMARRISRLCRIPIVHTYHTVYEDYTSYFCPSEKIGKIVAELFSSKILDRTHSVIVPSDKIYDMLMRYNIKKAVYTVPSGISVDAYIEDDKVSRKQLRDSLGISDSECIMIYIGRLAKEKNIGSIFEFIKEVCEEQQRMLIVGDGPYREELEKKAKDMGIYERLIFTGMVEPDIIARYYKAGDIFVSASNSETQGITYMEAMASGLPLLCKRDECLSDVIRQEINGFMYTNETDFFSYLKKLTDDVEYRKGIGIEARKSVVERYSIQAFAKSCVEVYEDTIEEYYSNGGGSVVA